ncbi:hypothetical protein K435DRAFT_795720 [Dendrothele bispora CBS 962.96]|uniref:HNH nuclease domain-containing protein n=1 Tax=Dendrothele bispora (strain CBS 962.96) TaxID=1314807 RepID=A0A4S8M7X2_DENBC|nr:hypothetical protein K435DRAFT_795720 [Dendrothele bispora CBS 962.96]
MIASYPLESVSTEFRPETSGLRSILLIPLDGQTTHDDFIARLANVEYSWGLEKGELDLVTSLNTIRVRADIVDHIEHHSLALVPTESTIKMMREITLHNSRCPADSRQRYTTLGSVPQPPVFEYVLLPLTITSPIYVRPPGSDTVQEYHYPYDGLPHFYSAGHPFHVVYNSISSVLFAPHPACSSDMYQSLLQSIEFLSDSWQNPAPREFMNGPNWADTHDSDSDSELSCLDHHGRDDDDDGDDEGDGVHSYIAKKTQWRYPNKLQSPRQQVQRPSLPPPPPVKNRGPRRHLYLRSTTLKRIDSWRKSVDVPGCYDEGVLNSTQLGQYEYEPALGFKVCRGTMALIILGASVWAPTSSR